MVATRSGGSSARHPRAGATAEASSLKKGVDDVRADDDELSSLRSMLIESQRQALAAKDETLAARNEAIRAKDGEIAALKRALQAEDALRDLLMAKDDIIASPQQQNNGARRTTTFSSASGIAVAPRHNKKGSAARSRSRAGEERVRRTEYSRSGSGSDSNSVVGAATRNSLYTRGLRAQRRYEDSTRQLVQADAKKPSPPQLPRCNLPEALSTDIFLANTFHYLDMNRIASAARVCSVWSAGVRELCRNDNNNDQELVSDNNDYWRNIAIDKWPEWAASIEQSLGRDYNYQSAIREKLVEQNDQVLKEWRPSRCREVLAGRPADIPKISWLFHTKQIECSFDTLSALSYEYDIPPPIYHRYENSMLAHYDLDDEGTYPVTLPSIPANLSRSARRKHEKAMKLVLKIYLDRKGNLLRNRPLFRYASDEALYMSLTLEKLSPTKILHGVRLIAESVSN